MNTADYLRFLFLWIIENRLQCSRNTFANNNLVEMAWVGLKQWEQSLEEAVFYKKQVDSQEKKEVKKWKWGQHWYLTDTLDRKRKKIKEWTHNILSGTTRNDSWVQKQERPLKSTWCSPKRKQTKHHNELPLYIYQDGQSIKSKQ